ncbi:aldose 1-epimerase [Bacillaceae bacterium SIJ1]|uniref:aldose 1-epimerase n=1 Tax=Litoribacterium kuwaitense TaxID=1398745 RepID=UPI0013EE2155|nr:aldose 1-epimerase [Litoribacterium kuwaitense]NGP45453.1 aldose 1-epimerase [Litoribacterium kuwaitense]
MHETKNVTYLGEDAVCAESNALSMTVVPKWGSNLISIRHKATNVPLLREPQTLEEYESRPMLFGTPVLFPPNRLADGKLYFRDRMYQFDLTEEERNNHIHGLVYDQPWHVVSQTADDEKAVVVTEYRSAEDAHAMRQFPHDFRLRLTYTLANTELTITAEIENLGAEPFPWGLGYHTTFNYPADGGDEFKLTVDHKWELDSERLIPTERWESFDSEKWHTGFSLQGVALDDAFYNEKAAEKNVCELKNPALPVDIYYTADQHFKHWVVYSGAGDSGFVCPEPYTWITNAPNLRMEERTTGVQILKSSEKTKVETVLRFVEK